MHAKNILYIMQPAYGHIDWGGVLETLQELKDMGHKVTIMSGEYIKDFVSKNHLDFVDIGLSPFRKRKPSEAIIDQLISHQLENFWNFEEQRISLERSLKYISDNKPDIILNDVLCKIGYFLHMITGLPLVSLGPHDFPKPDQEIFNRTKDHIEDFNYRMHHYMLRYGVDDCRFTFVQKSKLLNIVYSTPEFDGSIDKDLTYVGASSLKVHRTHDDNTKILFSSGTLFSDKKQIDVVAGLANKNNLELHMTSGNNNFPYKNYETIKLYQFIDDSKIFPRMDIIIAQGGLGTVTKAIRSARPMLVIPLMFGNYPQADKVKKYGNGLSIYLLNDQLDTISTCIDRLRRDYSIFEKKAMELQKVFASYGGSKRAAELIDGVLK